MTDPDYQRLRDLVLKAEGRTLEDELVVGAFIGIGYDLAPHQIKAIEESEYGSLPHSITSTYGRINPTSSADFRDEHLYRTESGYWRIIGLPITLERVLMALGTKSTAEYFASSFDGGIYMEDDDWPVAKWQLGKPLHEQSANTIRQLTAILS
jgi:hypothetical protein